MTTPTDNTSDDSPAGRTSNSAHIKSDTANKSDQDLQLASSAFQERLDRFVNDHFDEFVAFRRHLHSYPELSWNEFETTSMLEQRLVLGHLAPKVLPNGTGLICDIEIGQPDDKNKQATESSPPHRPENLTGQQVAKPVIALRGDIDALPIQDSKDVDYRSQHPGIAHACGHDVHATVVLGAGLALAQIASDRELIEKLHIPAGVVRLILQPAEEVMPVGARSVISAGGLDDVRAIFALHCDPKLNPGLIGIRNGAITSAADSLTIKLSGPGGHTARPHLTADLVTVAARVVTDLPAALARRMDSRAGVNLTFGAIHAGTVANVIPTSAELKGSLRVINREAWQQVPELVEEIIAAIILPYGAKYELDYMRGSPPIVNDPAAFRLVAKTARTALGEDSVREVEQSVGNEDFSWYLESVPGCFIRLGVKDPTKDEPALDLHTDTFDVEESSIATGIRLFATLALDALRKYGSAE